jgi:hypothetical protein
LAVFFDGASYVRCSDPASCSMERTSNAVQDIALSEISRDPPYLTTFTITPISIPSYFLTYDFIELKNFVVTFLSGFSTNIRLSDKIILYNISYLFHTTFNLLYHSQCMLVRPFLSTFKCIPLPFHVNYRPTLSQL